MKKLLILTLSFLLVACSQETKKSAPVEGKVIDASPVRQLNEKEVECLARNIFYEAGVEPYQGKLAVAQVTLNRIGMKKKWDSICKVVYAKSQFSWTLDPKKKYTKPKGPLWEASQKAAHDFLQGNEIKALKESDHYHADYVKPTWAKKMVKVKKIGRHIFYRQKD